MRDSFIITQNSIEAIDRAIAHETLMAREKPGSIVAPTLFGHFGLPRTLNVVSAKIATTGQGHRSMPSEGARAGS